MGVEGRERDKTLDAGASVISGQLGKTVQRLRKAYNLSLSELSEQSGVAKSKPPQAVLLVPAGLLLADPTEV